MADNPKLTPELAAILKKCKKERDDALVRLMSEEENPEEHRALKELYETAKTKYEIAERAVDYYLDKHWLHHYERIMAAVVAEMTKLQTKEYPTVYNILTKPEWSENDYNKLDAFLESVYDYRRRQVLHKEVQTIGRVKVSVV